MQGSSEEMAIGLWQSCMRDSLIADAQSMGALPLQVRDAMEIVSNCNLRATELHRLLHHLSVGTLPPPSSDAKRTESDDFLDANDMEMSIEEMDRQLDRRVRQARGIHGNGRGRPPGDAEE